MTGQGVSWIRDLFLPEEVPWRIPGRQASVGRPGTLSLKAAFWCAAGIGISLLIGNLM